MKNRLLFLILLFTISNFIVKCQALYVKGYFVDNNGFKTECLIENKDWESNPRELHYKMSETSIPRKLNTDSISLFELPGYSKYISKTLQVDKSSSDITNLSTVKNAVWQTEKLVLQVLVEGKACLYMYNELNLTRFFYSVNDSNTQQLVYKMYQVTNANGTNFVATNNNFRQQLFAEVNNPTYKYDLSKIMYEQKELTKYFEDYNAQFETIKKVLVKEKAKKDFFKASIMVGVNYTNMKVVDFYHPINSQDFGAFISPMVGAEFEFYLPFARNNWSILLQPVYNSKISGKLQGVRYTDGKPMESEFSYQGIDIPLGIRYRCSLNSKLNVYATGYVETGIMSWNNTTIAIDQKPFVILLARALTPGFSIGTNYNNIGLELKAFVNRDLLVRQQTFRTDFNVVSLGFKYRLVDLKINR